MIRVTFELRRLQIKGHNHNKLGTEEVGKFVSQTDKQAKRQTDRNRQPFACNNFD